MKTMSPIIVRIISFLKNSYFSSIIIQWNKPQDIWSTETFRMLKLKIFKFVRPTANTIFSCHNPIATKLHATIQLGISHFPKHKFRHSFQGTFNSLCSFSYSNCSDKRLNRPEPNWKY